VTLAEESAAHGGPPAPQAPRWFVDALATEPDVGCLEVDGARIAYRAWGPAGGDGVVLVHGGAAHARWWDHVAPLLARDVRVVAPDLSGHGDSDHRDGYGLDQWAAEVVAAAPAGGIGSRPFVIGHSLGGLVALRAGGRYGPGLRAVAAVDSPVRDVTPEERAARDGQAFGRLRVYPSREQAISRFRTLPAQETLPYVLRHVAETSLREVDGGWSWKFDPGIFTRDPAVHEPVLPVDCPAILLSGEFGLLAGRTPHPLTDRAGRRVPTVEIPEAAHHVMLDSPRALISSLRTLLAAWTRWPPREGPAPTGVRAGHP
jgi:pimeloyl-ACP methyl ester carboxylesterase